MAVHSDKIATVVVGIGELLWDLLPGGRQIGGAPANFAYHAHALGAQGVLVSAVGEDPDGQDLLMRLRPKGLDLDLVSILPGRPTGTVTVEVSGNGIPVYNIHEEVAWDHIPWTDAMESCAHGADAVCFGTLAQRSPVSRSTIQRFLRATGSSCLRVLDVNLRQSYYDRAIIQESLALSNVLKLNDEELPVVADVLGVTGSQGEILKTLCGRFRLLALALTRGEKGSLLMTPSETVDHPGVRVERIADTVGAGDSYAAALVMGLLRNDPPARICDQAARTAAFVCAHRGAMPPYPER
jgi:fructokinase